MLSNMLNDLAEAMKALEGKKKPAEAMDETVLQRVSLEQSSGAPCGIAWSARAQHKTAYMVRQLVDGIVVILQPAYSG